MWKIVEYFNENPKASAIDAVGYFEEEFDISTQIEALKDEGPRTEEIRMELRPLFAKKSELKEKQQYMLSDMESEVYMEYPPRKGSEAQRETLRNKLKKENSEYLELVEQQKEIARKISTLEDELQSLETKAKNARRLTELLQAYTVFITEYCGHKLDEKQSAEQNGGMF